MVTCRASSADLFDRAGHRRMRAVVHVVACGTAILTPALITVLLVYVCHGAALTDFTPPAHTNDETVYWHTTAAFVRYGFDGGHHTTDERSALLSFSRFGPYGPAFPVLYGSISRLLGGWHFYSAPLIHLILISLAVGIFILLAQPTTRQLVLISAFLATFWPMLYFIQTNMQEGLHYALGIVAAGLHSRLSSQANKRSVWITAVSVLFILAAAMFRITWLVLLIPFLLCTLRRLTAARVVLLVGGAVMAGTLVALLSSVLSSPHSLAKLTLADFYAEGVQGTTEFILSRCSHNTRSFLSYSSHPLEIYQRQQYVLVMVGLCIAYAAGGRPWPILTWTFHSFNLGAILLLTVLFYIVGNFGDYRLFSIHLLISAMYLASLKDRGSSVILVVWLASNLLIGPMFINTYIHKWKLSYDGTLRSQILKFQDEIKDSLVHEPWADAWCNTLSLWYEPPLRYGHELAGVPPGIGINCNFELARPRKSRYLLMSPDRYVLIKDHRRLRLLATLHVRETTMMIYENLDAGCDKQHCDIRR